MSWGSALRYAYDAATDTARAAADLAMSSAKAAAGAGTKAALAVKDAGVAAAKATGNALVTAGGAVKQAAVTVAKGTANVASFGARVVGGAVVQTLNVATAPSRAIFAAAKRQFSPTLPVRQAASEPCPDTEAGKRRRLDERNRLIAVGRQPVASPAKKAAAERLARNNEAVELARLSDDAYAQYGDPPKNSPPVGWTRVSDAELKERGLDGLVKDSKAAIYKTPPDWPGGSKTVLAFRGTDGKEDILVDHDQAFGVGTAQYKAAAQLGSRVQKEYGSSVLVTGHSLGGGKAQAAGVMGGLKGTTFNSAGLHPDSVGGLEPAADQFVQYRSQNDPLTGLQNSAVGQAEAASTAGPLGFLAGVLMKGVDATGKAVGLGGLSKENADYADKAVKLLPRAIKNVWETGNVTPPANGRIEEVRALTDTGAEVPALDPMGQHSIKNVVNGIEEQKTADVNVLQGN
jgi:type VI secretion system secreted protein VgrG